MSEPKPGKIILSMHRLGHWAKLVGWTYDLNSISITSRDHALLSLGYSMGVQGAKPEGVAHVSGNDLDRIEIEVREADEEA